MARQIKDLAQSITRDTDIKVLLSAIDEQDDPRDAYAMLQDRIRQYRTAGWSVPEDLIRVERSMMTDFMAESQGR
jgi:hypothetical protein